MADIKTDTEAAASKRHCAFCLELKPFKLCGGCRKRAYCSVTCQKDDWAPSRKGQGHKNYCKIECCEEDVDWEVKPVAGKGLGLVAKRLIRSMSRIIVEGVHYEPDNHPGIGHLTPADGPLQQKFLTNSFQGDLKHQQGRRYVCLRLSRVNHSCAPNAAHNYCETSKVEITYACRDIKEGEEICIAYRLFTNIRPLFHFPTVTVEYDAIRKSLEEIWGITCAPDCRCRDPALQSDVSQMRKYWSILETYSSCQPLKALKMADKILELQHKLEASWIAKANVHAEASHAAMSRPDRFKGEALYHARKVYEIFRAVCPYSEETKTHEKNYKTTLQLNEYY